MNFPGHTLKTYFKFSRVEKKQIIVSSVFMSVIFFLWSWGSWIQSDYSTISGILNFIFFFIVVTIALLVNISVQKYFAITKGYTAQFSCWVNGSLITMLLSFISMGWIFLLIPGTFTFKQEDRLRLGRFRYGMSYKNLGHIATFGVCGNLFLVLLLKPFYFWLGFEFIKTIIFINLVMALCMLIPIPRIEGVRTYEGGTPGFNLLYATRWLFVFVFTSFLAFALLAFFGGVFSLILAALIGFIVMLIFQKYIDARI